MSWSEAAAWRPDGGGVRVHVPAPRRASRAYSGLPRTAPTRAGAAAGPAGKNGPRGGREPSSRRLRRSETCLKTTFPEAR